MATFRHTGDAPRYFGDPIRRLLEPGDTVEIADELLADPTADQPQDGRFLIGEPLEAVTSPTTKRKPAKSGDTAPQE